MSHTPGPWFTFETKDEGKGTVQTIASVATYEESIANEDIDLTIAGIWSEQEIDKANARLIATAPEMYDELIKLADLLDGHIQSYLSGMCCNNALKDIEPALKLIAKIKGE